MESTSFLPELKPMQDNIITSYIVFVSIEKITNIKSSNFKKIKRYKNLTFNFP